MKIPAEYSAIYVGDEYDARERGIQPPSTYFKAPPFKAGSFTGALLTNLTELFPTGVSGRKLTGFHPKTPILS
jgi:hypothetical protein